MYNNAGSLVADDYLRFDFSHDSALTFDEFNDVQRDVNLAILEAMPVQARWKDLATARSEGAMALFGEKYGEEVRTITIGNGDGQYSYELCGGTHLDNTAIIGSFIIMQETAVGQGIRRIAAVTGKRAYQMAAHRLVMVRSLSEQLQTNAENLPDRVTGLQTELKYRDREITDLRQRLAKSEFTERLAEHSDNLNGARVLVTEVATTDGETLRKMADWFRDEVSSNGVLVVGMVAESGNPQLLAAVTKDLTDTVHAGNLIKEIARIVGGGGGGRPNMAQAGGKDASKLGDALNRAKALIAEALG